MNAFPASTQVNGLPAKPKVQPSGADEKEEPVEDATEATEESKDEKAPQLSEQKLL